MDLWNTIQDGHSGNPIVWTRDLGGDPYEQADPFYIPPQGSLLLRRNSSRARCVKAVGVPIFGGSYGESGTRGNVDIHPLPTEYHYPVYYNLYDTLYMSVEIMSERTTGETMVVGKWGCIPIPGWS